MPSVLRILIVDDERLARSSIRRRLGERGDVEIVGECADGVSAVEAIRSLAPDLVLLDIQMPGMTGMEVVRAVGAEQMPLFVFLTAYDEFAIQAFEENAVDYLLKPFDPERLGRALERARSRLQVGPQGDGVAELRAVVDRIVGAGSYRERFLVRIGYRMKVISAAQVDWIEADDKHVKLHVGRQTHLIRESLNAIDQALDPRQFVRIHRSTIVRIDRVQGLEPWNHSEHLVVLEDGTKLATGRSYRERVRHVFGI